jgi:hypothetical protein
MSDPRQKKMERYPDAWQARLPAELTAWVIRPRRVESFHDDSVPASKWRGYDASGNLCYYHHCFTQWDDVFDDEEPYRRLILSESLEAWRRLDGRWLRVLQRDVGPHRCHGGSFHSGFEVVAAQAIPRL